MLIIRTFPEIHDLVRLPDSQVARVTEINHRTKTLLVETATGELEFSWSEDLEFVQGKQIRSIGATIENRGNFVEIKPYTGELTR